MYREHVDERDEMFGVAEDGSGGFKYSEAPDRGWQQGKRDFTHKVNNSFLLETKYYTHPFLVKKMKESLDYNNMSICYCTYLLYILFSH